MIEEKKTCDFCDGEALALEEHRDDVGGLVHVHQACAEAMRAKGSLAPSTAAMAVGATFTAGVAVASVVKCQCGHLTNERMGYEPDARIARETPGPHQRAWPDPNARRAEVEAFLAIHMPTPGPPHEAPPVENGPSLVCNACGVVRVSMLTPFCKSCLASLAAAGIDPEGPAR